jgi:hypothetical protein
VNVVVAKAAETSEQLRPARMPRARAVLAVLTETDYEAKMDSALITTSMLAQVRTVFADCSNVIVYQRAQTDKQPRADTCAQVLTEVQNSVYAAQALRNIIAEREGRVDFAKSMKVCSATAITLPTLIQQTGRHCRVRRCSKNTTI